MVEKTILKMENITKIYGNGIIANFEVNFDLREGEIHALAGENGAGKSTLMKILYGMEKYDSGSITYNGKDLDMNSPMDAISEGIGMVHQHFMLVPSLTVAENLVLGFEPKKHGFLIDNEEILRQSEEISKKFNLEVDPKAKVADLSVGLKQKVEILKALMKGAKILIFDEPTAVLTPQETEELFVQLVELKKSGYTIVFISHKLNEIKEICDRITILRNGRYQGTHDVEGITIPEISRLMVGRDIETTIDKLPANPNEVVLEVDGVSYINEIDKMVVNNVSFKVRKNEILGIAGVEGNGQRELIDMITGLSETSAGDIKINGESMIKKSIRQIRDMGLAHIPEDRMVYGVASDAGIKDNLMSDRIDSKKFHKGILLNEKMMEAQANDLIDSYKIKTDSPNREVGMLSGGNIQKVVVAREMTSGYDILIADQPTRGVDVGAARIIHEKIIAMREEDHAILLVSADINEVLLISDSLLVFYGGEIVAYFQDMSEIDEEELGLYMLGIKKQEKEEIERCFR